MHKKIVCCSKVKKWCNEKCEELRNNETMKRYVGKDITNIICNEYIKVGSQVCVHNPVTKMLNMNKNNDIIEQEIKKYSGIIVPQLAFRTHAMSHPYITDKSLRCYTMLFQTSKGCVDNEYRDDGKSLTFRCDDLVGKINVCVQKMFESSWISTTSFLTIKKEGGTIIFDKEKRKISESGGGGIDYIRKNLKQDTVIRMIIQFDQMFESYKLIPSIKQMRVYGQMEKSYFLKLEFVDDNFHILEKYLNYDTLQRRLKVCNSYNTIRPLEIINNGLYIQTPYMSVTFDIVNNCNGNGNSTINNNAMTSICVTVDKENIPLLDLVKSIYSEFINDCEKEKTQNSIHTYMNPVFNQSDHHNAYIRVSRYFGEQIQCTSWYDQYNNSYSGREALLHIKRGTKIRCIYSYSKYSQHVRRDENGINHTKKGIFPVLHQCQFIKDDLLNETECMISSDSDDE